MGSRWFASFRALSRILRGLAIRGRGAVRPSSGRRLDLRGLISASASMISASVIRTEPSPSRLRTAPNARPLPPAAPRVVRELRREPPSGTEIADVLVPLARSNDLLQRARGPSHADTVSHCVRPRRWPISGSRFTAAAMSNIGERLRDVAGKWTGGVDLFGCIPTWPRRLAPSRNVSPTSSTTERHPSVKSRSAASGESRLDDTHTRRLYLLSLKRKTG